MTEQNKSPEAIQDVRLLSLPENLKEIIYTACKTCYSDENPGEIFEEATVNYGFDNNCPEVWFNDSGESECQLQNDRPCYFNLHECEDYLDYGSSYDLAVCQEWKEKLENHILKNKTAEEKILKLINKVLSSNHYSTVEHCYFVFSLSGLSRAMTHQIVRHRHMSFSQKSQRYVTEKGQFEYVVPDSILELEKNERRCMVIQKIGDNEKRVTFSKLMSMISCAYDSLIEQGIPAEDARYILPNAASSSMVASLNLRELIHLANLRTCMKAQKEIRDTVKKMCDLVIEKEPWTAAYLVPNCVKNGVCKEMNGCGRKF